MGAFRAKGACAVGVKDEAKGFIDADIDMIAASAHGDIGFNIDQTGCLIAGYSQIFDCTLFTECFCLMKDWFTACPFDVFQCEHMPCPLILPAILAWNKREERLPFQMESWDDKMFTWFSEHMQTKSRKS